MSVKIKISYNTDEELAVVLQLLSPAIKSYKIAKKQEGAHKNCYTLLSNSKVNKLK